MLQRPAAASTDEDWQLQRRNVVLHFLLSTARRDAGDGRSRAVRRRSSRPLVVSSIRLVVFGSLLTDTTPRRYKHNWRYHKELRLWLTKEAGTEPTQKTQSYERGSYIFFDPTLWERVKKDFVLVRLLFSRSLVLLSAPSRDRWTNVVR